MEEEETYYLWMHHVKFLPKKIIDKMCEKLVERKISINGKFKQYLREKLKCKETRDEDIVKRYLQNMTRREKERMISVCAGLQGDEMMRAFREVYRELTEEERKEILARIVYKHLK